MSRSWNGIPASPRTQKFIFSDDRRTIHQPHLRTSVGVLQEQVTVIVTVEITDSSDGPARISSEYYSSIAVAEAVH